MQRNKFFFFLKKKIFHPDGDSFTIGFDGRVSEDMENAFCFQPTLNECTARTRSVSAIRVTGSNWVHGTWVWNGPSRTVKYYENGVDQNRNNVYTGGTNSAIARVKKKKFLFLLFLNFLKMFPRSYLVPLRVGQIILDAILMDLLLLVLLLGRNLIFLNFF